MYQIDKIQYLQIGVQGENVAQTIDIDMSTWAEEFPDAAFHVIFKPYNATAPSPMLTTYEAPVLHWTVTLGATAVAGVGYTEVRAQDAETGLIKKSKIIPTAVENSVSGVETDPPASYQEWVDAVLNSAAAVLAAAHGKQVKFEIDTDTGHLMLCYSDDETVTVDTEWTEVDLGPVNAYAIAVLKGYEGTADEFAQYMANIANGASAAASSASAAAASAADALEHTQSVIETWLGNNITEPEYPLDRTLAISTAAAPADMVGDLKSAVTHSDTNINTSAGLWGINSAKSYNRIETKGWYHGFDYKLALTSSDYLLNVKAFDDEGNLIGYADTTNSSIISQSEGYFVSSQNPIDLSVLASQYYLSFVIRKRVNGSNVPATTDDYVGIELWKSVYEWQSEDDKIKANFVKTVNLFDKDSPLIKANTFITGSAYASGSGYNASCPIAVEIGKTYKFPHGAGMGSTHRGFYVEDDGTFIEAFDTTIADGFETFTATRTGYVAVNLGSGDFSQTMFCLQNEYPQTFVPFGRILASDFKFNEWQKEYIADKDNEIVVNTNPLFQKKAVFDGDSICAANTNNERRGWALRIIDKNSMTGANVGVGGATITQGTQKSGVDRHWVSAYINTIHTNYPTLDYYIFEGGTNDADLFRTHPEKKGTFDPVDFSGNYDTETFCGALEYLIFTATSYYPTAKIGYIIPPKMGPLDASTGMTGYTAETNRRKAYFDTAIEICKKWGVPYIDLWDSCPMNPSLLCYYNASESTNNFYADGQHPTAKGYDLFTPMIEAWMKSL